MQRWRRFVNGGGYPRRPTRRRPIQPPPAQADGLTEPVEPGGGWKSCSGRARRTARPPWTANVHEGPTPAAPTRRRAALLPPIGSHQRQPLGWEVGGKRVSGERVETVWVKSEKKCASSFFSFRRLLLSSRLSKLSSSSSRACGARTQSHPLTTKPPPMSFFQRVLNHLLHTVVVEGLANKCVSFVVCGFESKARGGRRAAWRCALCPAAAAMGGRGGAARDCGRRRHPPTLFFLPPSLPTQPHVPTLCRALQRGRRRAGQKVGGQASGTGQECNRVCGNVSGRGEERVGRSGQRGAAAQGVNVKKKRAGLWS